MPLFTTVTASDAKNESVDVFGGYNHNMKIADGEFYDMMNLTSDYFPLMASRGKRHEARTFIRKTSPDSENPGEHTISNVLGMAMDENGDIYLIADIVPNTYIFPNPHLLKLFKDCGSYPDYSRFADCSVQFINSMRGESEIDFTNDPKQMIITGTDLYIFPDKVKVKKSWEEWEIDEGEYGYRFKAEKLEAEIERVASAAVPITYEPCDKDGKVYSSYTKSDTAPESPDKGSIWVDTSEINPVWKEYSGNAWNAIPKMYVRIGYGSITSEWLDLKDGDGAKIDIRSSEPEASSLNGTHVIVKTGKYMTAPPLMQLREYIVIPGVITQNISDTGEDETIIISRKLPDMDFVVLAQNRMWGCRYSETDNIDEIYASKLGDFTNWNVFQGISTDSYAASVGTPGKWTGAVNINGSPVFFKENYVHKVYVSSSGAHQIVDKPCTGVKDGCSASVCMVGDLCFYMSNIGAVIYDGSTWAQIAEAFGNEMYSDVCGFAFQDKYYFSGTDRRGEYSLFAYDKAKKLWHREDASEIKHAVSDYSEAVIFNKTVNALQIIGREASTQTEEETIEWRAITGLQGYSYTGEKYISRFNIRMMLPIGSFVDVYIEYDSDGYWHDHGRIEGAGTRAFILPIRPRRCDHFRIKLEGCGVCRIYSFAKFFEGGSDVI